MKRAKAAQAGLTMVEVVIAAIILTAIAAMSSYLVWSSSRTVSSTEAALQLENTAREALNVMVQELRQAKKIAIAKVETKPTSSIAIYPPNPVQSMAPNDKRLGTAVSPVPEDEDFDGIRFDLIDPRNTFSLDDFKNSTERIYTVQYWWEVEHEEQRVPVQAGKGPNDREPNAKDDNRNGVVDEGVLMKMETTFFPDRVTVEERRISTVLRNVKKLTFRVPSATSAADVAAGKPNYKSDRIEIKIDLEIQDPKHNLQKVADAAGKEAVLIMKSVSAIVDFRN